MGYSSLIKRDETPYGRINIKCIRQKKFKFKSDNST